MHFLGEHTAGEGPGELGCGGSSLPRHGRIVEHEDTLRAEQGSQAPGHDVVQHDGARRQADGAQRQVPARTEKHFP